MKKKEPDKKFTAGSLIVLLPLIIGRSKELWKKHKNKKYAKKLCRNLSFCFQSIYGGEFTKSIPLKQLGKLNRLTQSIYSVKLPQKTLVKLFSTKQENQIHNEKSNQEITNFKRERDFIIDWLISNQKVNRISKENYYHNIFKSEICTMFEFSPNDYNELMNKLGGSNE